MSPEFKSCEELTRAAVDKFMEEFMLITPCDQGKAYVLENSLHDFAHALVENDVRGAITAVGSLLEAVFSFFGIKANKKDNLMAFKLLGLAAAGDFGHNNLKSALDCFRDSLNPSDTINIDYTALSLQSALMWLVNSSSSDIDKKFVTLFPVMLMKCLRETKNPLHVCVKAAAVAVYEDCVK